MKTGLHYSNVCSGLSSFRDLELRSVNLGASPPLLIAAFTFIQVWLMKRRRSCWLQSSTWTNICRFYGNWERKNVSDKKANWWKSLFKRRTELFSLCAQILSLLSDGWNNSRPASPVICCTLWGSKLEREGSCEAVMRFHKVVLSVGKSNRLEYQWDVPESVTAHLLSDHNFSAVLLWTV